ncbi:MAG: hypothetical protein DMG36_12765 [Acidobacteria bacterium]|nr:MAG: hypothetical protein DMG36_12765 [Acidobacteriota bacterium]
MEFSLVPVRGGYFTASSAEKEVSLGSQNPTTRLAVAWQGSQSNLLLRPSCVIGLQLERKK